MQDFLTQTFYGNTMNQWAVALGITLAAYLVGKTLYWLTSGILRRLTAHTESKVDDVLLDTIDEPLMVLTTVLGVRVAGSTLQLSEAASEFLGNATQAAVVLAVTWILARLWDSVVKGVLTPLAAKTETNLDEQLLPIARRGGRTAIWILGLIVALNNAGYDVAALIAGLGIGGLALAMAAKDTVANVFGGFTIFTDRPFILRDRIVISGIDGTVADIGIRSTKLRKLDGREVTIPNSRFADSPVENVTREPSRKVTLKLGLTYDTNPQQMQRAMEILREISAGHAENTFEEQAVIGFNEFGDFSMNLLFIYYIQPGQDILGTQTSINLQILERFNLEGLEFAFPTQTIHTVA
jgi:MscS family membrane protein